MLLSIFKGKSPLILLLITLVAFVLWFNRFTGFAHLPAFVFDKSPMPLYAFLNNLLQGLPFWRTLLAFTVIILQAFLIVNINTKYYFIGERTYLPALLFILLASSIPDLNRLNPASFSSLFLLLSIDRILGSFRKEGLAYNFLDASFFISIASLFYANSIFFILMVWLGLLIFRSFRFREWLYTFIGLILPYIFLVSFYYITQQDVAAKMGLLTQNINEIEIHFPPRPVHYIFMLLAAILIVVSGRKVGFSIVKMKIHARKTNWFLLSIFIAILFLFIVIPSASFELIIPAAIPLSYNFSYYFLNARKKTFANIFLTLFIVVVIIVQYYQGPLPFIPADWAINQIPNIPKN